MIRIGCNAQCSDQDCQLAQKMLRDVHQAEKVGG